MGIIKQIRASVNIAMPETNEYQYKTTCLYQLATICRQGHFSIENNIKLNLIPERERKRESNIYIYIHIYGWWTKLRNTGQMFVLGSFFRKCVLPEGLAKELPTIVKSQNVLTYRLNSGFTHFHIQIRCKKTPQMH